MSHCSEENVPFATSHSAGCTVSRFVTTSDMKRQSEICTVCRVIWNGATTILDSYHVYSGITGTLPLHERFARFAFSERSPGDEGPLRVDLERASKLSYSSKDPAVIRLQYYHEKGVHFPWSDIGAAEHISTSGLSRNTIELSKQLINDCDGGSRKHTECKPFINNNMPLPARVLDIGQSLGSIIKLRTSRGEETGRYAALSHCWGTSVPTKTTVANMTQHIEDGIPNIPRTFADAILTTRALGLRYLWIDSLCIIQDSPEDWATQAPQMAKIYGNAYVTISADAARDSTHGFLNTSRRKLYPSKSIFIRHGGRTHVIFVRERGALAYQLPYHDWTPRNSRASDPGDYADLHTEADSNHDHNYRDSPPVSRLSTRGWVMQERVLSPRTLHFGGAELGWECRSIITCECSATSKRRRRGSSLLKEAVSSMSWTTVVEEYTRMNLTFQTDRLVALSGLAEYRHQVQSIATRESTSGSRRITDLTTKTGSADESSNDYIAGMWTQDLQHQLLWRPASTSRRVPIAPTWSWASVGSPVSYDKNSKPNKQFEILEVSRRPSNSGKYGNCPIGSYLLVQGLVIPVKAVGRGIVPIDYLDTLSYRLVTSEDVVGEDIPLQLPDIPLTYGGLYLMMTSSVPDPPAGLVLLGACEVSHNEKTSVRHYQRRGFATARQLIKYESWSDDDTSEEEILPSEKDTYDWRWDIWERYGKLETFRLY